jgi:hypothetical protein
VQPQLSLVQPQSEQRLSLDDDLVSFKTPIALATASPFMFVCSLIEKNAIARNSKDIHMRRNPTKIIVKKAPIKNISPVSPNRSTFDTFERSDSVLLARKPVIIANTKKTTRALKAAVKKGVSPAQFQVDIGDQGVPAICINDFQTNVAPIITPTTTKIIAQNALLKMPPAE